ncbi:MAG: quinone-dependent dihydroorotate dehydrogenase [Hyphomicrobiaceae bacterium]|nr:quinone-dependent dihydroorotate dehydrogenase [Hyphomicrobiaceae bacterium]
MLATLFDVTRPLLFALEPEQAHELTLRSLEAGVHPRPHGPDDARLAVTVLGLDLPNPFGIAAGFDKDARVPDAVLGMGFGHAEIGSVTPRPQPGNPRPRVFRLVDDLAMINRLGFNNAGHAAALARLSARARAGVVGVNVGANKDSEDKAADYVAGLTAFADVASYFTINVSSPNTPGLRDLQAPAALDALVARVLAERDRIAHATGRRRPVVVKLAPDIAEEDLAPVVAVLAARKVDGIAMGNTTLARHGLSKASGMLARETGGLSGRPLFHRATVLLARVYRLTEGRIPLIGIGGITDGASAVAKVEAGASLLQLYTGLVYGGPGLLPRMKAALVAHIEAGRLARIGEAVGRRAAEWADKPLVP